ncbi:MAG: L,D-transpeptidase family protein [Betaproteobacteria bacterium]|nr:L,D-transpeptidase family protein [Betaproteobacteria bacterium]
MIQITVLIRILHIVWVLLVALVLMAVSVRAHAGRDTDMDFLGQQKQYARVKGAFRSKADALDRRLGAHGLKSTGLNILIVAYKAEAILDIYAKGSDAASYEKLASYPVCASSGKPGPKRRVGDWQVPEGFYRINRFNPASNFHLSLGIDYPNAADKLKAHAADLGGDIFIHGSCVTVGCLPMTNTVIEEIYLYAVYARNSGQKTIPVYIFPFQMTQENMEKYEAIYRKQPEMLAFWHNLKQGYDKFIKNGNALTVGVMKDGDYDFGSK